MFLKETEPHKMVKNFFTLKDPNHKNLFWKYAQIEMDTNKEQKIVLDDYNYWFFMLKEPEIPEKEKEDFDLYDYRKNRRLEGRDEIIGVYEDKQKNNCLLEFTESKCRSHYNNYSIVNIL